MSVARPGPSEPQVLRLIAEVASASAPAGPERAALALRSPTPATATAPMSQLHKAGSNHGRNPGVSREITEVEQQHGYGASLAREQALAEDALRCSARAHFFPAILPEWPRARVEHRWPRAIPASGRGSEPVCHRMRSGRIRRNLVWMPPTHLAESVNTAGCLLPARTSTNGHTVTFSAHFMTWHRRRIRRAINRRRASGAAADQPPPERSHADRHLGTRLRRVSA
jgi:hypothetical protein